MADEVDDWVAWDALDKAINGSFPGDPDGIFARLKAGREGSGAALTAAECGWVLACWVSPSKPRGRPPKDNVLYFERLARTEDIRARLQAISEGHGTTSLTADECSTVLACLMMPPKPNHRQPDYGAHSRHQAVALHCGRLEGKYRLEGMSERKALLIAVSATAKKFDCSRKQVHASREAVFK